MMKAIWIIGAVIVVGIGIVAGVIFAGGSEPQSAPTAATKGIGSVVGTSAVVSTPVAALIVPVSDATPAEAASAEPNSQPSPDTASSGRLVIDTLDELFANARSYDHKDVVVRGTIVTQCISGCTFSLEDGTAVIAVELIDDALDHVLDGGSVGRSVEVRGTVETSPQLVIVIDDPEDWNYID